MADAGPGAVGVHPQYEIAEALVECADAGLRVVPLQGHHTWGRIECATGARSLAVPLVAGLPAVHAKRIRVFSAEHRGHSGHRGQSGRLGNAGPFGNDR